VKVLVVADVVGGVRTFVEELARGLASAPVELHLALLGADPVDCAGARSCELRNLALEWMEDSWEDVSATAEWIERLRLDHEPDIIHMNTFAPVLDPHVSVLLTVHSCVLTWWRAVHGDDPPDAWDRYARLARQALDRTNLLAAPSRALLSELAAVHRDLPRARVIPNGRSVCGPAPRRRERLVVTAGRLWDEAKNAALVARAAPAIHGRVALIGPRELDGHAAPAAGGELRGLASLGGLPQGEVLRWLRRAAVFAEPARYEPFGLAALEAALCGCALVLGDIASLREVWRDSAVFVSPGDADALAAAVNGLLDDPRRRARAAAAARARALRYTRQAMANGYLRAYREAARAVIAA
jgi:glycogen synthase